MVFHNLIGGLQFPVQEVAVGDIRIGNATPNPIGYSLNQLNYLLLSVKSWIPAASWADSLGNSFFPDWWNNSSGTLPQYQLPGDASLPNNNIWSAFPNPTGSTGTGYFYPNFANINWSTIGPSQSATTTPFFDDQTKYPISFGTGLDDTNSNASGISFNLFNLVVPVNATPSFFSYRLAIFFDGDLYYPPLQFWSADRTTLNTGGNVGSVIGSLTTPFGKSCNIYGADGTQTASFDLTVNNEW